MPPMSLDDPALLDVCELFRSIAGETTHAGRPAAFARLAGCNLRCRWCDTRRTWEPGRRLERKAVRALLLSGGDRLAVVTGGEPLMQAGALPLCAELVEEGMEVLLETNGSLDISGVPEGVHVVLDMKPPSSGEEGSMDRDNLRRLRSGDELKLVIADRGDFAWACALLDEAGLPGSVHALFSPAHRMLEPERLAEWMLGAGRQERLQIQLHKVIWPRGPEGVSLA